jgi:hypothetical protein
MLSLDFPIVNEFIEEPFTDYLGFLRDSQEMGNLACSRNYPLKLLHILTMITGNLDYTFVNQFLHASKIDRSLFPFSHNIWLGTLLLVVHLSFASIRADIDAIDSRVQWSGVPSLKLGEQWSVQDFRCGGMIEVRNDPRFNQGILPNHNWRGYALVGFEEPIWQMNSVHLKLPLEFHHESAHATMGIQETTVSAFEKIYDGQYRNVNRNVFGTGLNTQLGEKSHLNIEVRYLRYWKSRNTPEATNSLLSNGHGFSLGGTWSRPVFRKSLSDGRLSLSSFIRKEFEGEQRYSTQLYSGDTVETTYYAVLQRTYTISAMLSLDAPLKQSKQRIGVFIQALRGNAGGFQDSRENVQTIACGLTIHQ